MRAISILLLAELGISANYKGYFFLLSAMDLLDVLCPQSIQVTKDIYPDVAKLHQTSAKNVEQGIKTVIQICWEKGNSEFLCLLCSTTCKPTPSQFVSGLAAYLESRRPHGPPPGEVHEHAAVGFR